MYKLTLTYEERKAIDWVGNRYAHGDQLRNILEDCSADPDDENYWDNYADITFSIAENLAWEICELIKIDNMACFASELTSKLWQFEANVT